MQTRHDDSKALFSLDRIQRREETTAGARNRTFELLMGNIGEYGLQSAESSVDEDGAGDGEAEGDAAELAEKDESYAVCHVDWFEHALDDCVTGLKVCPYANAEEDFVTVDFSCRGAEADTGWKMLGKGRGALELEEERGRTYRGEHRQ